MVEKQNPTTGSAGLRQKPSLPTSLPEKKSITNLLLKNLRGKKNAQAKKREKLREELWPGSRDDLWDRKSEKGFTTIPRLLPLVMHLIKIIATKGNPSPVYLELWARAFDEHIITINDEEGAAYACGYTGSAHMAGTYLRP